MATLQQEIISWRGTNQSGEGHNGVLSKLKIDNKLYDIKDPAVEALAEKVESRLDTLENKTWTAVNKGSNEAKFATAVTQGVDGAITVTYGSIRDTALTDSATAGQFVTAISQSVDGQITAVKGAVDAEYVNVSSTNIDSTNVKEALEEIFADAMALKGTSSDLSSAETIAAAKKYADEKVQQLAGEDWTANAKKVQDIIKELEGTDGAAWATLVDKLDGMAYELTGVMTTATSVADYVEHKIAEVNAANDSSISDLDAVVAATSGNAGNNGVSDKTTADTTYQNATNDLVALKITEIDGKIDSVNLKTNDIARASDLTTLDNAVVKSVNGQTPTNGAATVYAGHINLSSSDNTTVAAKLTSLDSTKANANAFNKTTVNNWTVTYDSTNEALQWSLATPEVYVPTANPITPTT